METTPVTYRQISPDEWGRLQEIYRENGAELPEAERNTAIVAEVAGRVVGMWGINLVIHAGPLWVDPEWRGKGVSDGMSKALDALVRPLASGYLMFPSNAASERVARRIGLEEMNWKVFRREF